MEFKDVWTYYNKVIEKINEKHGKQIALIDDSSEGFVRAKEFEKFFTITIACLVARCKAKVTIKWRSFSSSDDDGPSISKDVFEAKMNSFLKEKKVDSLLQFIESELVSISSSPSKISSPKATSSSSSPKAIPSPKVKSSPPKVLEDEEEEEKEEEVKPKKKVTRKSRTVGKKSEEEEESDEEEEEERKPKKQRNLRKKIQDGEQESKKTESDDDEGDVKHNDEDDFFEGTRFGILLYKDPDLDPRVWPVVMYTEKKSGKCTAQWFEINEETQKLELSLGWNEHYESERNHLEVVGKFVDGKVPDEMIEKFVESPRTCEWFQNNRQIIFSKMVEWLTKDQKVKWHSWAKKRWSEDFDEEFRKYLRDKKQRLKNLQEKNERLKKRSKSKK